MTRARGVVRRAIGCRMVWLCVCLALIGASPVEAQSRVRVDSDQTTIWRAGFTVAAAVVPSGTVLDVVGRSGNWYEVELPRRPGSQVVTGFVAVSRVTALDQNPVRRPAAVPPAGQSRRGPPRRRPYSLRLFAQGGVSRFTADDTFTAVLGRPNGLWWGGGVHGRSGNGWQVEVAADVFQATGTRVFAFEDEVFDLGIPVTVRLVPVTASLGYRFWTRGARAAYASVGAGRVFVRERSDDADADEDIDADVATYQVVGGFELRSQSSVSMAIEAQYSLTPNALTNAVATAYGERDLGGAQLRLKVLFGR